jgi:hypothetical protein
VEVKEAVLQLYVVEKFNGPTTVGQYMLPFVPSCHTHCRSQHVLTIRKNTQPVSGNDLLACLLGGIKSLCEKCLIQLKNTTVTPISTFHKQRVLDAVRVMLIRGGS